MTKPGTYKKASDARNDASAGIHKVIPSRSSANAVFFAVEWSPAMMGERIIRKTGWYWWPIGVAYAPRGPFTSSTAAYRDGRKTLQRG